MIGLSMQVEIGLSVHNCFGHNHYLEANFSPSIIRSRPFVSLASFSTDYNAKLENAKNIVKFE